MLTHPTLDLLRQLGLNGMAKAFSEIEASGDAATMSHPEWLALLLDREVSYRRDRRLLARLRYARLRHHAPSEKRHTCAISSSVMSGCATLHARSENRR